ncbi:MAG: glycosyltransferase N-terminal domain-containing protein [Verrucomicrobiota bacterium]
MWFYQLLLKLLFPAAMPGWLWKTATRGGWNRKLAERFGIYHGPPDFEPCHATHVHAVSVGETILALKLIREWRAIDPSVAFVLAIGTPTGRAVAEDSALANVRVTYVPFDFKWMMRAYFRRFEPARIILVEGEAWPNLMHLAAARKIPVSLVNARMSLRSARGYRKFANLLRPVFSKLSLVCTQEPEDHDVWKLLGIAPEKIVCTGSLKFDPAGSSVPQKHAEFAALISAFGKSTVVLAASTHAGEEVLLANAIDEAIPHALPIIAPRHAERAAEVSTALTAAGFDVYLRSSGSLASVTTRPLLLIDTTGELRDWTAHADLVIIGKSFLSTGGQNPAEAILASKPVIIGPHMENFEPLVSRLVSSDGVIRAETGSIASAIRTALDPASAANLTHNARKLLDHHAGATRRIIALVIR